jgi:hypothetical protein
VSARFRRTHRSSHMQSSMAPSCRQAGIPASIGGDESTGKNTQDRHLSGWPTASARLDWNRHRVPPLRGATLRLSATEWRLCYWALYGTEYWDPDSGGALNAIFLFQEGSVKGWLCGEAYATNKRPRGIFASSDIFLRTWYVGDCSGALASTCFHVRVVSHRRSDVSHCLARL